MNTIEIETWASRVLHSAKNRYPVEDSCVELKSQWPSDTQKAARQLAGHANASRGSDLLWLIGVDEKTGLATGVPETEFSAWWPKVVSCLEGTHPEVHQVNIPIDDVVVVALHFKTDRAPYLVNNPEFGKGCSAIKFEVPWREGNSTRTAKRLDLLSILLPKTKQPEFEILKASIFPNENSSNKLRSSCHVYIAPQRQLQFVYPRHKMNFTIEVGGVMLQAIDFGLHTSAFRKSHLARFITSTNIKNARNLNASEKIESIISTDNELIVNGPGKIEVTSSFNLVEKIDLNQPVAMHLTFGSAHEQTNCNLKCMFPERSADGTWNWEKKQMQILC